MKRKNIEIEDKPDASEGLFDFFRAADTRPIWQWAEDHITLPHSARRSFFSSDTAPYIKAPLEALQSPSVRECTVVAAVQSSKSTIAEVYANWIISEDPGPVMWNFQTDDDAKTAAETRIWPMFNRCKPVAAKIQQGNSKRRTQTVIFNDGSFLVIQGANAPSNLQSQSIRYLINDEVWLWPAGHLDEARKRVTAFWNSKILNVTSGGVVGDDVDMAFRAGTMCEWSFECPKCRTVQPWKWSQLKWDDNTTTRTLTGEWKLQEVAKTIRYECAGESCKQTFIDQPNIRKALNARGVYRAMNENPVPNKVSFHWNALAVEWIPWASLVNEFLAAVDAARHAVMLPLQEFTQKRLAEQWEERAPEDKVTVPSSDYNQGDDWELEKMRFMTVDVQEDHFWYVIRAWAENGASRLVRCGKLGTFDDVRECQQENRVPDKCVLPDAAHRTREVYFWSCVYGWTCVIGSDKKSFSHQCRDGKVKTSLISKPERGDPLMGAHRQAFATGRMKTRYATVFHWSGPGIKDVLESHARGRGPEWQIPRDTPDEWFIHMRSEIKVVRRHPFTGRPETVWKLIGKKQNHMRDCECEQIVAAVIARLLGDGLPENE